VRAAIHAWGNHHFVIGGGVKGGQFYGNFPLLVAGGANDANSRGVLIPTTAVDQYGSTLAVRRGPRQPAPSVPEHREFRKQQTRFPWLSASVSPEVALRSWDGW